MIKKTADTLFKPLKCDFSFAADDSQFYIYSIRNREEDKYYIGISRHPQTRMNWQLKNKNVLSDDYAKACKALQEDISFEAGVINTGYNGQYGYPSAFLGCIAEVLYMIDLEKQNKELYNERKLGGHPSLGDKNNEERLAFEAVAKIVDPSQGQPSDKGMRALENNMPEIRHYIEHTEGQDVINDTLLKKLEKAWDQYTEKRKSNGFGRASISDEPTYLINYVKLTVSNDNNDHFSAPKNDAHPEVS